MNLNNLYIYKLKILFNKRANPIDNDTVLFVRCDNEFNELISLKARNNSEFSLHRWYECLNEKKIPCDLHCYKPYDPFNSFLRVLPNVFSINNNDYYQGKNLFISYFIHQLKNIDRIDAENNLDQYKSDFINYLFYEIGFGDNFDKNFVVEDDVLYFICDKNEGGSQREKVMNMLSSIHDLAKQYVKKGQEETLIKINKFHCDTINFLTSYDEDYHLPFEDYNVDYTYPDFFIKKYSENQSEIFKVIKDCVSSGQERMNVFVSKIIVMNYIYYVLKNKPEEVLLLKEFCGKSNDLFFDILSFILKMKFYVRKEHFKGLHLGYYLSRVEI
ncbi:hypothetical protein [Xenorhabdus hominickii]|uniref:Uncharacterized protein n=1 Tax=Xenorhabdus hominickii TaxID=351679 RepID=A0A2G0QFJ8_XENHO|nr:hypothetical protein [Xenorhabdus hominickii]AOM41996.1 hypothetical protein A9255_16370 [Xenorhabdus hominickii]PHM57978.1 hypothetical protein Xhom_00982 [Xenorhabdus hominickii]